MIGPNEDWGNRSRLGANKGYLSQVGNRKAQALRNELLAYISLAAKSDCGAERTKTNG